MIVTCTNCATKFNLPDAHARPGAKVKCSVCEHVFPIPVPEADAEPEAEEGFSMEDMTAGPPDEDAGESEFTFPEPGADEDGDDGFGEDFAAEFALDEDDGPEVDDLFDTPDLEEDSGSLPFGDEGSGEGDDLFESSEDDDLGGDLFESGDEDPEAMFSDELAKAEEGVAEDMDDLGTFSEPESYADPEPDHDFDPSRDRGEPLLESEPPDDIPPEPVVEDEDILDDTGELSFDLDKSASRKKAKKTKKAKKGGKSRAAREGRSGGMGQLLVLLVLILVIAGGVVYFVAPETLSIIGLGPGQEEQGDGPAVGPDDEIFIEVRGVRQYVVENDILGLLCVIQGVAVNNYDVPKELIKIEVDLLDATGQSVANQNRLIGNTVTLFQLTNMNADELEAALSNSVNIMTQNTNVPPGGEVPFEFVFINPPDTVREFYLRVVDFQDPPKE